MAGLRNKGAKFVNRQKIIWRKWGQICSKGRNMIKKDIFWPKNLEIKRKKTYLCKVLTNIIIH